MNGMRDYQMACVDAIFREWEQGNESTLAVLCTGAGKTVIASEVIRRIQPKRVLFFCHRDTLAYQARDTITRFAGVQCGIEMADMEADAGLFSLDQVVIGTVQTQNASGRMTKFKPNEFDLLIADEFHHFVAPSFRKVLDYYRQNLNLKILGLTATPDRADEKALGQICKSVAYEYEILDAIHDGWLVPIDQIMVPVSGLDYSHISTTAGDLNQGELRRVVEEEETIQRMIQPTLEMSWGLDLHALDNHPVEEWGKMLEALGKPRRTLVFCATVVQAQKFTEIMNRVRTDMSACVWGKLPKDERQKLLKSFSAGQTQIMCNVGVLTEGFDNPFVEVVVMGRATKSRSLYTQIIGRGTRVLPGIVETIPTREERRAAIASSAKPSVLVVDFVGNSGRHKLITSADILGGRVSDEAVEMATKKAAKAGRPVRVSDALDESEEIIHQRIEKAKKDAEARRVKLVARAQFTAFKVNPFEAYDIAPARVRGWDDGKHLSEKQSAVLLKQGINPDDYSYAEGKQILNETFRRWNNKLATLKQCALLHKHGYETKELTMKEASKLIDQLKANGWKRLTHKIELDESF